MRLGKWLLATGRKLAWEPDSHIAIAAYLTRDEVVIQLLRVPDGTAQDTV